MNDPQNEQNDEVQVEKPKKVTGKKKRSKHKKGRKSDDLRAAEEGVAGKKNGKKKGTHRKKRDKHSKDKKTSSVDKKKKKKTKSTRKHDGQDSLKADDTKEYEFPKVPEILLSGRVKSDKVPLKKDFIDNAPEPSFLKTRSTQVETKVIEPEKKPSSQMREKVRSKRNEISNTQPSKSERKPSPKPFELPLNELNETQSESIVRGRRLATESPIMVDMDMIGRLGMYAERHNVEVKKKEAFDWLALNRHTNLKESEYFYSILETAIGDFAIEKKLFIQTIELMVVQNLLTSENKASLLNLINVTDKPTVSISHAAFMIKKVNKKYRN